MLQTFKCAGFLLNLRESLETQTLIEKVQSSNSIPLHLTSSVWTHQSKSMNEVANEKTGGWRGRIFWTWWRGFGRNCGYHGTNQVGNNSHLHWIKNLGTSLEHANDMLRLNPQLFNQSMIGHWKFSNFLRKKCYQTVNATLTSPSPNEKHRTQQEKKIRQTERERERAKRIYAPSWESISSSSRCILFSVSTQLPSCSL